MSTRSRLLVGDAIEAIVLLSPTSFSWFGRPVGVLPAEVAEAMDRASARAYLLYSLQLQLYENLYCRGFASPAEAGAGRGLARRPAAFVEALAASNTGRGSREPGWSVVAAGEANVVVERDGLKLWIAPGDVVGAADGDLPPGARVHVRLPSELRKLSPGFYMALGDAGFETDPPTAVVRLYWHLASASAPPLIHALTSRLNRAGLPFRVKVVNDPARYTRCDAGVLYVHRADYDEVAGVVRGVYGALAAALRRATPAFAKPLAPGLAVAEDPGTGDSFGMHRARLVAEGIVGARERGFVERADVVDAVAERFAEDGFDLDASHLNPGSVDRYAL